MGSVAQVVGGVVGGAIGFVFGGPAGAIVGFSLGYKIGGLVAPPDLPSATKPTDDFNVTGASEGTPVAWMVGRRIIKGSIIFFGPVDIEEVTENPGKGGGGSSVVVETKAFSAVHLVLFLGELVEIHAITDNKGTDWIATTEEKGGEAYEYSSGTGTDFGYAPESSPLTGIASMYSSRAYLGSNTTNMTPLEIEASAAAPDIFGDPTEGMPEGSVNPAAVYWLVLTNEQYGRGLSPSELSTDAFQDAFDIYKLEGLGIAPLVEGGQVVFDSVIDNLNFHANSILRRGFDGALELFPLRWPNIEVFEISEEEVSDVQVTQQSWDFVPNLFVGTFRDRELRYTNRVVRHANEAVQANTGLVQTRTYDFPWFTDRDVASARLFELMEELSFPAPVLALKCGKKFHNVRPGDVLALTHSRLGFDGTEYQGYFRVLEIDDADFGKQGIRMKARLIRKQLLVNYTPPNQNAAAPALDTDPKVPIKVGALSDTWDHRRVSKPGPPDLPGIPPFAPGVPGVPIVGNPDLPIGPFAEGSENSYVPPLIDPDWPGYPLRLWASKGGGREVAFLAKSIAEDSADLPSGEAGNTLSTRWARAFCLGEGLGAEDYLPGDVPVPLIDAGYPNQPVPNYGHDDVGVNGFLSAMENSRYALLIGNTELALFRSIVRTSPTTFEVRGMLRGANKEYLYAWPANTPVLVVDTRTPALSPSLSYLDWAMRQRSVKRVDYALGVRIRSFFQSVNLGSRVTPPDDSFGGADGQTWLDRSGDVAAASSLYRPENEIRCRRGPMPSCVAYLAGADGEERSWYAADNLSPAPFSVVVEFPPFVDDSTGYGDRVVYDADFLSLDFPYGPPATSWGASPHISEDGGFDEHLEAGTGLAVGQTYRLYIMQNVDDDPIQSPALRTIDVVIGSDLTWPAFEYSVESALIDATAAFGGSLTLLWASITMYVAVLGAQDLPCRPRVVDAFGSVFSQRRDPAYAVSPSES